MPSNSGVPSWETQSTLASSRRQIPNADLELRDIVLTLRRRKAIVFIAVVIGILLAAIWTGLSTKRYSATATIEINKESGGLQGLEDLSGITAGLSGGDQMNTDMLTQQAVIMSDNTALGVIEHLGLDSQAPYAIPADKSSKDTPLNREKGIPLEKAPNQRERVLSLFRSGLSVKIIKGTRLISITYTDTDPNRSMAIANAVVEAYIDEYTQARYEASSKTSSWLTSKLAELKSKIADTQSRVENFQRESGLVGMATPTLERRSGKNISAPTASTNVPLDRLLELNQDLTSAEIQRIEKEAIYRMTETQDPEAVLGVGSSALVRDLGAGSVLSPGSTDITLLQQLRAQQAQLKVQLAASSTKYGENNPAILQLKNQEDALDSQIRAELVRIRARAKNELDLATLSESGIRERVTAQEREVSKTGAKADQLVLLQEEALSSREIYQDLYAKLEEASVTAGMKASDITLVDPARTPAKPSSLSSARSIELGGALGVILGLIAAYLWDYFDDSISTPEQVEELTSTPVIAVIPDFRQKQGGLSSYGRVGKSDVPAGNSWSPWLVKAPRSQISEAYRTFRTAILLSRADHPPRVIMITSGSPNEGKSTTCFNLASALAMQGDRVLYIDADMRRSSAEQFFNCSNEAGLSNCLTSGLRYTEALKPHPDLGTLFLLPAGPHPPNPSELLGSARFSGLLGELRSDFDFVLIDTPPVLLVTDAQLISPLSDGYVLILRSGKTTKRLLQRSLGLMVTPKAAAFGIVVNAISSTTAAYEGYGYYGKGGNYYGEGA